MISVVHSSQIHHRFTEAKSPHWMNNDMTDRHPIRVRYVDDLTDRIEFVHQRIGQRDHERRLSVRALRPPSSESWSAAERDLFFEPETGIREWGHGVIVEIDCPDVDPT